MLTRLSSRVESHNLFFLGVWSPTVRKRTLWKIRPPLHSDYPRRDSAPTSLFMQHCQAATLPRPHLDVAVSNHCGRLIANIVIAYTTPCSCLGCWVVIWQLATKRLWTCSGESHQQRGSICIFLGITHCRNKHWPIDLETILAEIGRE